MKTYLELIKLSTFEERLDYLMLDGKVCDETFGKERYLNQALYNSAEWKRVRREVIARDNACDLGCEGYDIYECILIHHLNPITIEDILNRSPKIFDLNNLISTTKRTHNAIHFSDKSLAICEPVIRTRNDTKLW